MAQAKKILRNYKSQHLFLEERRQLSFVTINGNLTINLKLTQSPLLNGKGQFTFLRTNRHTLVALLCTHQNLNFLEINNFW